LSNEIDVSFIFPVVDFITSANEFQKNQIFRQPSKVFGKKKGCRASETVIEAINLFGIFLVIKTVYRKQI